MIRYEEHKPPKMEFKIYGVRVVRKRQKKQDNWIGRDDTIIMMNVQHELIVLCFRQKTKSGWRLLLSDVYFTLFSTPVFCFPAAALSHSASADYSFYTDLCRNKIVAFKELQYIFSLAATD